MLPMLKADSEVEETTLEKSVDLGEHPHAKATQQLSPIPQPPYPEPRDTGVGKHHPSPPSPTSRRSLKEDTNPFYRSGLAAIMIPEAYKDNLDIHYLSSLAGVLKLSEIMLGFVSFILAICADRRSTSAAWAEYISFESTLLVIILLLGYVVFPHLTLQNAKTREGLTLVELLFYGINTLFYFIGVWLMVHLASIGTADGRGAAIMDSILCVALTLVYAVETFTKFRNWRNGCEGGNTNNTPGISSKGQQQQNARPASYSQHPTVPQSTASQRNLPQQQRHNESRGSVEELEHSTV